MQALAHSSSALRDRLEPSRNIRVEDSVCCTRELCHALQAERRSRRWCLVEHNFPAHAYASPFDSNVRTLTFPTKRKIASKDRRGSTCSECDGGSSTEEAAQQCSRTKYYVLGSADFGRRFEYPCILRACSKSRVPDLSQYHGDERLPHPVIVSLFTLLYRTGQLERLLDFAHHEHVCILFSKWVGSFFFAYPLQLLILFVGLQAEKAFRVAKPRTY